VNGCEWRQGLEEMSCMWHGTPTRPGSEERAPHLGLSDGGGWVGWQEMAPFCCYWTSTHQGWMISWYLNIKYQ